MRPRHLAILTLLATSSKEVRRDALAAMFWGEETDARARHSLSNALSALRQTLGPSSITARRDTIELAANVRLAVDAIEFAAACEARDDARAAVLYQGEFLPELVVQDAPEFEAWIARERGRLECLFLAMCERRAPVLLKAGEWDACAALADAWLRAAPRSTLAFTSLLRARSGPATAVALRAALTEFARLRDWLDSEYGLRPDATVLDVVRELEERLVVTERSLAASLRPDDPPAIVTRAPDFDGANSKRARPRSSASLRYASLTLGAVVLLGAVFVRSTRSTHASTITPARPIVAITSIANLRPDTSLAWLDDGLPQLISDDLAAGGTIEAVAPMRVRDVLARRGTASAASLSQSDALDVARRVGATWSVRGSLTGGGGAYILNLDVREVATGADVESFTVMAKNPVTLGELAAARLLDMATSAPGGSNAPPRFVAAAASPEAYRHFVLGLQAEGERRFPVDERELDAAIALDSSFMDALLARRDLARVRSEDALARRLDSLIARHADHMSEWDRMRDETYRALYAAEVDRSEALAARLVERFRRDPRAYDVRAEVLGSHGKWLAADSVLRQELSLDSLAIEAGEGPCAPCSAYSGLVAIRLMRGDIASAETAARRWVALQPGVPGSWDMLSMSLEFGGKFDDAIDAARRTVSLTTDPSLAGDLARTFIIARRFDEADSVIRVLQTSGPIGRQRAADLSLTIERERGQFQRAAAMPNATARALGLELVQADNLVRVGRMADARRLYETSGHWSAPRQAAALDPGQARAFAWAHALEGDALWRSGDTIRVHALADSVRVIGARSYYGRDWGLYHHLNGLLALSRHDTVTAERELSAARYGVAGWTTTVAMLARIRLAHGDGAGAVALLRDAYEGPLDAMGRYVTRTELDDLMALSFARAGQLDSARVYASRVRAAWRDADPEIRRGLASLP